MRAKRATRKSKAAKSPTPLQELRRQIKRQGAGWRPRKTPLSALTKQEKSLRLGFRPKSQTASLTHRERAAARRTPSHMKAMAAITLAPSKVDWRDVDGKNFVTPVKEQLGCGACTAFAICAAIESQILIAADGKGPTPDLSEAHLFYVHGRAVGVVCAGGWNPDDALDACVDPGIADEACYPYQPGDQDGTTFLCANWQSRAVKITAWHLTTSPPDMKKWLATRGPMVAGMTAFDDFFSYGSGVYQRTSDVRVDGHVVCVIGYDDGQQCWICKNSFGPAWGESGFFRIGYGQCGIDAVMWAVEGIV